MFMVIKRVPTEKRRKVVRGKTVFPEQKIDALIRVNWTDGKTFFAEDHFALVKHLKCLAFRV